MKFKFSLKWLFVVTTVIAVLMGIAAWLEMFSNDSRVLAACVFYFLIYLSIAGVFFGPRYIREWKGFRAHLNHQRLTRERLEAEAQELLASLNAKAADAKKEQEENYNGNPTRKGGQEAN